MDFSTVMPYFGSSGVQLPPGHGEELMPDEARHRLEIPGTATSKPIAEFMVLRPGNPMAHLALRNNRAVLKNGIADLPQLIIVFQKSCAGSHRLIPARKSATHSPRFKYSAGIERRLLLALTLFRAFCERSHPTIAAP
jgi:hypothetical protein